MAPFERITQTLPEAIAAAHRDGVSSIVALSQRLGDSAERIVEAIAARVGMRAVSAKEVEAVRVVWRHVTPAESRDRRVLEVQDGDHVAVLIDDPWNDELLDWLVDRIGRRPVALLATPEALRRRIVTELQQLADGQSPTPSSAVPSSTAPTMANRRTSAARETSAIARTNGKAVPPGVHETGASPVVRFVHSAVEEAWRAHASDVHFEATRAGLALKYRLDGVLVEQEDLDEPALAPQIISRIKVMAELDIAEKRVPQDGRFSIELGARLVDCRVSIMPSAHGEDAVIRILDKRHLAATGAALTLTSLGFDDGTRARLRELAAQPHGMLLVTGPTGSGKTTTLYALLGEIRTGNEKIVTIEDPIEYDVAGVLQVPVNEKKGLTFARGLRSILRHDPDIIMVGEIRDRETADIAIQSALTGHLVFTTVHANTAFDVVSRFTHMGVDLYGFVSCLNGVLAQRLVRLTCTHCARPDEAQRHCLAEWLASPADPHAIADARTSRGAGCDRCRGTGYSGRTAIGEVLPIDDRLRDLLVARAPVLEIKQHVGVLGGRSLRSAAAQLVASGQTTLDEVRRVVGLA
jgi:general secretion pathway protein E